MIDYINDRIMVGVYLLVFCVFLYEGGWFFVIGSDFCLMYKVVYGNGKFRFMLVIEVGEGV